MDKLKKNKHQAIDNNKKINIKNKINSKKKQPDLNELKKIKDENLRLLAEIDNLRKTFESCPQRAYNFQVC